MFLLLTDAESLRDVAVNVAAIEVVEERDGGGVWVQTSQHSVVVDKSIAEVFGMLAETIGDAP